MLNISWPFLSSLLGGCNSKAPANPRKSDDKNGQEMSNWSEEVHSEKKYVLIIKYWLSRDFSKLCFILQHYSFIRYQSYINWLFSSNNAWLFFTTYIKWPVRKQGVCNIFGFLNSSWVSWWSVWSKSSYFGRLKKGGNLFFQSLKSSGFD